MMDEQIHLTNAQDQAGVFMQHIDRALSSEWPDEMRAQVQEAMAAGQAMQDQLEEALSEIDDPEIADRIDDSMNQLNIAMDQGDQALDTPDDELESVVQDMRIHAQRSVESLSDLLGVEI